MTARSVTVWSWREGILKSGLPGTTKLLLLTLAVYMNDMGEGCYPSVKQLSADASLSERAICEHIERACEAGWLKKVKHGYGGQKWARNEYVATYPLHIGMRREGEKLVTIEPEKALTENQRLVDKGTDAGSVPSEKALTLTTEGTYPDDKKALTEGQSNSPLELSIELSKPSSPTPAGEDVSVDNEDKSKIVGGEELSDAEITRRAREIGDWINEFCCIVRSLAFSPILSWVQWGYSFELDIKPAVRLWRAKHPHQGVGSYKWFEESIERHFNDRQRQRPRTTAQLQAEQMKPAISAEDVAATIAAAPEVLRPVAQEFIGLHGAGKWRNWIAPLSFEGVDDRVARFAAPSRFICDRVKNEHSKDLLAAMKPHMDVERIEIV